MTATVFKRKARGSLLGLLFASLAVPAAAHGQFLLGLSDGGFGQQASTSAAVRNDYAAMAAIHGSVLRINLDWASIAPGGHVMPNGFDAADAAAPGYDWSATDAGVRYAAQHHLQLILTVFDAPQWAQGPGPQKSYVSPGAWDPNPSDLAAFLRAAAVRYGGSFPDPLHPGADLPRVRDWEPWNEPNIPGYFSAPGNPVDAYRTLLNLAYTTLKAVHRDNLVVLGGLAPVSPVPGSIPPLQFGAELLCVRAVGTGYERVPSCPQTHFDVFAIHPYSLDATPTKHAYKPGDVLVGDIGEVGALVRAADRLQTSAPRIQHQLWVTEFAWLTNPPDPAYGDSAAVAARYVAYSMYEMWSAGVSLVVWFGVTDPPGAVGAQWGGGLYTSSGQPKLTLRAFAFPVIAAVSSGQGLVWGRAPVSGRAHVIVEQLLGGSWRRLQTVLTGTDGVFEAHFPATGNGVYRAQVVGGPTSLPYNSQPIPPQRTHTTKIF